MSIVSFDKLLEKQRPKITKKATTFRGPVCAEERLTLTQSGKSMLCCGFTFLKK